MHTKNSASYSINERNVNNSTSVVVLVNLTRANSDGNINAL